MFLYNNIRTYLDIHNTYIVRKKKLWEIKQEKFAELALESKMNCPISGVLNCEIQLDASLV